MFNYYFVNLINVWNHWFFIIATLLFCFIKCFQSNLYKIKRLLDSISTERLAFSCFLETPRKLYTENKKNIIEKYIYTCIIHTGNLLTFLFGAFFISYKAWKNILAVLWWKLWVAHWPLLTWSILKQYKIYNPRSWKYTCIPETC